MVELYERVGPESERVLKQPSTSEAGFRDFLRNFGDFRLLIQAALRNDNTYVKSMAGPHQYDTNKWAASTTLLCLTRTGHPAPPGVNLVAIKRCMGMGMGMGLEGKGVVMGMGLEWEGDLRSSEQAYPAGNYQASLVGEFLMEYSLLSDTQRSTSMVELQKQKTGYGAVLHLRGPSKEAMYRECFTDQTLEH